MYYTEMFNIAITLLHISHSDAFKDVVDEANSR